MKNYFIVMFAFILIISSTSSLAAANTSVNNNSTKRVDAKCHVALFGGAETIYARSIKSNELKQLAARIVNLKVMTELSTKKQKIYKVFECVLVNDDFSRLKARQIYEKIAR